MATAYLSSGIIALMFGLAPDYDRASIGHFVFQLHLARIAMDGNDGRPFAGLGIICFGGETAACAPSGIVLMLLSVLTYTCLIFWVKKS